MGGWGGGGLGDYQKIIPAHPPSKKYWSIPKAAFIPENVA